MNGVCAGVVGESSKLIWLLFRGFYRQICLKVVRCPRVFAECWLMLDDWFLGYAPICLVRAICVCLCALGLGRGWCGVMVVGACAVVVQVESGCETMSGFCGH